MVELIFLQQEIIQVQIELHRSVLAGRLTSPNGLTLTYVAAAGILGACTFFTVGGGFYFRRAGILTWVRTSETARTLIWFAEGAFAIALSVIGGVFDLYKTATWNQPSGSLVIGSPLFAGVLAAYLWVKVLTNQAKDKDSAEIKALKGTLALTTSEHEDLKARLRTNVRIAHTVREVVNAKLVRVLQAFKEHPQLTVEEYLEALSPEDQVQVIMAMIHDFFRFELEHSQKLRLGIYVRDDEDRNVLVPAYSYDGEKFEGVFSDNSSRMRIDAIGSAESLMIQVFRSQKPLLVVPSCAQAVRDETFSYFHIEQKEYLRSMIAFRHRIQREDGSPDVTIVTLDTTQDGFFGRYTEDEITLFLTEMMKRVEFELIGARIHSTLRPPKNG